MDRWAAMWVPSMVHSAVVPSLSRQRMSALPSPLKSPVPSTCHSAPTVPKAGSTGRGAVHLPERDRAVVGAPQDVGLAVAVEIAGADDMPFARRPCRGWCWRRSGCRSSARARPRRCRCARGCRLVDRRRNRRAPRRAIRCRRRRGSCWSAIWLPFICQSASAPLSLRQRMSALPSPPKSAVPSMCHSVPTTPKLGVGSDLRAVHQPGGDRAVVGAPEHVARAVAVEIGDAVDVPLGADVPRLVLDCDLRAVHLRERHARRRRRAAGDRPCDRR